MNKITPFLWFNGRIQEALDFYTSIFPNSRVLDTQPGWNGELMSASLELEGQRLTLFNGGPHFQLNPAVSLYVNCETQAEVDELWRKLLEGGGEESQCGWLVDRFGLSWQIIPSALPKLLFGPDQAKSKRVMDAMMQMQKLDVAKLEAAAAAG